MCRVVYRFFEVKMPLSKFEANPKTSSSSKLRFFSLAHLCLNYYFGAYARIYFLANWLVSHMGHIQAINFGIARIALWMATLAVAYQHPLYRKLNSPTTDILASKIFPGSPSASQVCHFPFPGSA